MKELVPILLTFGWRVLIFSATCAFAVVVVGVFAYLFVFEDPSTASTGKPTAPTAPAPPAETPGDPVPA